MQQQLLQVEKPYDFKLIPQLFLREIARYTPYAYLANEWSCLIPIGDKQIPVIINPQKSTDADFLQVCIYGDVNKKDTKKVLEIIKKSFNADLNLQDFYKHVSLDLKLEKIVTKLIGLKPYHSLDPYHSLIRTVIRQLISAQTALGVMTLLVTRLGDEYKTENKILYGMPSPEKLAKASKQQLLKCKVGYKWKLIKTLAQDIVTGDLDLHHLSTKDDSYVIERLMEYNGIGDWTARTFLFDGLHRIDSYPIYDISVVKAISTLYYNSKSIGKAEVDEFFDRYEGFRGLAITYLFGSIWLHRINQ